MTDVLDARPDADNPLAAGRNELGVISIGDSVVAKIAARAAAENPDAGAAALRMFGRAVPGAGRLGTRGADLDGLPKTSVDVDGAKAFVSLEVSVRWPASIRTVTESVREHVRSRVHELTGLDVDEVRISVVDLVTDIASPPRVK